MGVFQDFFSRLFEKSDSTEWCTTYIDVNNFRRDRVKNLLQESGLVVRLSSHSVLVKQDEYSEAMSVLKKNGY